MRLATTVVDLMPARREDAIAEAAGYAATDLLCYRAAGPAELVARQAATWQPWLDWAERRFDARLRARHWRDAGAIRTRWRCAPCTPPSSGSTTGAWSGCTRPRRRPARWSSGWRSSDDVLDAERAFAAALLDELLRDRAVGRGRRAGGPPGPTAGRPHRGGALSASCCASQSDIGAGDQAGTGHARDQIDHRLQDEPRHSRRDAVAPPSAADVSSTDWTRPIAAPSSARPRVSSSRAANSRSAWPRVSRQERDHRDGRSSTLIAGRTRLRRRNRSEPTRTPVPPTRRYRPAPMRRAPLRSDRR